MRIGDDVAKTQTRLLQDKGVEWYCYARLDLSFCVTVENISNEIASCVCVCGTAK